LRIKPTLLLSLILCCALVTTAGCGYTTKTLIPTQYKTIYIDTFKNKIDITQETSRNHSFKIYRPFLEVDITNTVIDRFVYDGSLTVSRQPQADLVLTGELTGFVRQPLKYADNNEVEEYRLSVIVDFEVTETATKKEILKMKDIIGDTTYFTVGALSQTEETALGDAVDDLARRVVERTVEFW